MYIKVQVTPKARKELLTKRSEDSFTVAVKEPAERNLANRRVLELLARYYEIPVSKVKIMTGHHSPVKMLSIDI